MTTGIAYRRPKNIYKVGSMRVWSVINPPNSPRHYPVNSWQHAAKLIEALADSQLLDKNIHSNAFGLEVLESDGEWCEWENDEGDDISTIEHTHENALLSALQEISKGEGVFSRDPLEHASNTINSMKEMARAAIAKATT